MFSATVRRRQRRCVRGKRRSAVSNQREACEIRGRSKSTIQRKQATRRRFAVVERSPSARGTCARHERGGLVSTARARARARSPQRRTKPRHLVRVTLAPARQLLSETRAVDLFLKGLSVRGIRSGRLRRSRRARWARARSAFRKSWRDSRLGAPVLVALRDLVHRAAFVGLRLPVGEQELNLVQALLQLDNGSLLRWTNGPRSWQDAGASYGYVYTYLYIYGRRSLLRRRARSRGHRRA